MNAAITRLTDGQLQELMRTDPESAMKEARRRCLKRERDRERNWRDTDKGAFESSMLSLDEHVKRFKDPSKIATFSDGGTGAEAVRNGGEGLRSGVVDPSLKKQMLNRLRKYPYLQKSLRRFIGNATSKKRKPVKKTHIKKICEILFDPIKTGV